MFATLPSATLIARVALGALLLGAAPQEKQLLRLKFQSSDMAFHLQSKMSQSTDMNGQKMGMDSSSEVFASVALQPGEDAAAFILKLSRIKVNLDGMMGKIEMDTDKKDAIPPMMGDVTGSLGKEVKSTVTSTGKLANLEMPGASENPMGGGAQQFVGPFEQLYTELPQDPVAVGDSWSTDRTRAMGPTEVHFTVVNTLSKLEGSIATITQKIDIDADSLKDGMISKMEIKSAVGELVLDLATGMPVSFSSKMAMDMEAMGATASITSETHCERAPKAAAADAGP